MEFVVESYKQPKDFMEYYKVIIKLSCLVDFRNISKEITTGLAGWHGYFVNYATDSFNHEKFL